jgi:tRNA (guanine-N7-)-methyltransferase
MVIPAPPPVLAHAGRLVSFAKSGIPETPPVVLRTVPRHAMETVRDNGRVQPTETEAKQPVITPSGRNSRLYPRVTSFRSRRGALTPAQQGAWERHWGTLGCDVHDDRLDVAAWFGRHAPVVLEIGCGTGTSTVAMAQAEPRLNVLAVDVYQPGLAQLLQAIERENVDNIRAVRGDAVDVLEHMIASGALTGVRVFFPDPWPKARHHKRRLLQPATVALIADRLAPGGALHVATDFAPYAEYIAEVGDAEPRLCRITAAQAPISCARPITKFESKAHRAGSAVTELLWGKMPV